MLITGLHTVADIFCTVCNTNLGWKYEAAFEEGQKYKVCLASTFNDCGVAEQSKSIACICCAFRSQEATELVSDLCMKSCTLAACAYALYVRPVVVGSIF